MAVYERNDPYKNQLTKGLASGLSGVLEGLASSKMQEIDRQRTAQGLESVGFGREEAKGLSQLNPELQKTVLGTQAAKSKEQSKSEQIGQKESHKYFQTVNKEAQGAKENDARLQKMKTLIATGKLTNPAFAGLLKTLNKGVFGFGIDLSGLLNKESQQFDKLSADFIKGAKNVFGSRITDNDLNQFLKTIPSLTQSNEGKIAIINNLEAFNKASELRKQVATALIKENGGRTPANLEFLVDQFAGSELDKLAQEFSGKENEKVAPTQTFLGAAGRGVGNLLLGSS